METWYGTKNIYFQVEHVFLHQTWGKRRTLSQDFALRYKSTISTEIKNITKASKDSVNELDNNS